MVKPSSPELARRGPPPVPPEAPASTAPLEPQVERGEGLGPVPPDNRPGRREDHPQDKPDLDAFAEHFRRHDDDVDQSAARDDEAHGSAARDDEAHGVLGDPVEPTARERTEEARRRRGPILRAVRAACRVPVRAAAVSLAVTDAGLAASRVTVQALRSRLRDLERR